MNSEFDGIRQVLVHEEKSVNSPDFKKFTCSKRNVELTWRRCISDYVSANSLVFSKKLIRLPEAGESWSEKCVACEIGKRIREKFAES